MFIDDDQLAVALGATLGKTGVTGLGSLDEREQIKASAANADAYDCILDALQERGLTVAQIDTWRGGVRYQRSIAQYLAILEINGLEGIPVDRAATWGYLDLRKELATVALYDTNGDPLEPEDSGQIGYGTLNTDGDLNVADPYDRRRGTVTKW